MTTYTTTARCVEPGCRCLDSAGVILYRGPDRQAAQEAEEAAPRGYEVQTTLETCHDRPYDTRPDHAHGRR